MHRVRTPSMAALTAFEAAARHESFTLAARELSITESAVSRQVSLLEKNLNVSLFIRVKQRVILTRSGRLYSEQVRASLHRLEKDTQAIAAHGSGKGNLELAVLPTFSVEWLIPRLAGFYAQHPNIRINMGVRTRPFSFEDEHFNVAIHHGKPIWPHAKIEFLFGERMIAVAQRSLIQDQIQCAADVLNFPLLYSTTRPESWQQWFKAAHVPTHLKPAHSEGFELQSMVVRAAEAGLGIALVPEFFIPESAWANGLVKAYELSIPAEDAYHLVYPNEQWDNQALQCFRSWILAQAQEFSRSANLVPDPGATL